jgi:hypothetical protein
MDKAGLKLFLKYAWPCSEEKLKSGQIDQSRFNILKLLAENGDAPPVLLLEKVYPGAVDRYREFCANKGYEADFALESVAKYWQENHINRGYCSVKLATVCLIDNDKKVVAVCEDKTVRLENPYRMKNLKTRDTIRVHRGAVVEKVD